MFTKEEKRFQIIGNIVMVILSLNALLPMILMVMSSITDNGTLIRNGYKFIPEKLSLAAYKYAFSVGMSIPRAFVVSIILTFTGVMCALMVTTPIAYAISKKNMVGRGPLTFFIFFTMLFNGGLVPTYMNYVNVIHLKNTFWALLIPNLLCGGFNIMLMKSYFVSSIPEEIMEAARIDGASEFRVFTTIAIPLAKPIIATIGLFAGLAYWNDWMNGWIYVTSRTDLYSVQNLLNRIVQNVQYLTQNSENIANADAGLAALPDVSIRMAMAVLGMLPVLAVYPFVQKSFVKGITLGGVKG